MNSPNPIIEETEGNCLVPSSKLVYGRYKGCIKKTEAENNPGSETEHKIEEAKKEKSEKKGKKSPVKKIRKKRELIYPKIIITNPDNHEINQKRKKSSKKLSKKIRKKFSYYFKKKSRNKTIKNLTKENSNSFVGGTVSSLTNLNERSPGQEKKLKFDIESVACLFVGIEEEYDFYNMEKISLIASNKEYRT